MAKCAIYLDKSTILEEGETYTIEKPFKARAFCKGYSAHICDWESNLLAFGSIVGVKHKKLLKSSPMVRETPKISEITFKVDLVCDY